MRGGNPVVCPASDQCHAAGLCQPATGACTNPPSPNGTVCSDTDACTQTDTCQAGTCVGANPVTCMASDQCHVAGVCQPSTGLCSDPPAPEGTACNDADACTQNDTCQVGTCVGANPVTCMTSDQCHAAGVCQPSTGSCTNPPSPNGTACNDTNTCTQNDTCQAGTCVGANPVTCMASDQCHVAGVCQPATGTCTNPPRPDGTTCNDGDVCTHTDVCQAGTCSGGGPLVTEYPSGLVQPRSIVAGPDGSMWFVSPETAPGAANGSVGRLTPNTGAVTTFATDKRLNDIAPASDGNLWLAEKLPVSMFGLAALGRITTDGIFLPDLVGLPAERVCGGPDGNLWFTSAADGLYFVGAIRTDMDLITAFLVVSNAPRGIAAGPDGNVWFTESNGGADPAAIGRVTPDNVLTEFPISTTGDLNGIITGPDGNLWFADAGQNEIGRISPGGTGLTKFPVPTAASGPQGITTGPDGNLWFTEQSSNRIGRITPSGQITELTCIPTANSGPSSISAGPDGYLWITQTTAGSIARLRLP